MNTEICHPPEHEVAAETPVFDYRGTLARLGGSENLFSDLARFFVEDSEPLLASLREALSRRDQHAAEMAVHRLKGLIANFGAHRAYVAVADAEHSVRSGKLDEVAAIYPRLEAMVLELRGVLSLSPGRPQSDFPVRAPASSPPRKS